MEDLKGLETSLTSSMEAQMHEMREMITRLMQCKSPPPPEDPDSLLAGKALAKPIDEKPWDDDEHKDTNKDASSSSKKGRLEGGPHDVPWTSPDPPIPRPHIK